jgi:general stress protein YciG
MADQNNPGQFGNREDTEEQARKGGQASSGSFGSDKSADPSQGGRKGVQAQPTEAKARGGENSHQGSNN